MIKWLFKYSAAILIFNTILLSIPETKKYGDYIFKSVMFIFATLLILNPRTIKDIIFLKCFSFFLIINIINLIYFFAFHFNFLQDFSSNDFKALEYVLARGVQFSIISISVYFNFDFYREKFLEYLVNFVFVLFLISLIVNPDLFSGRYSGIIWNPNMLSSLAVIVFSILFLRKKIRSFDIFKLSLFFLFAISSGSRGTLVALCLVFLIKYGFSFKNFVIGVLLLISFIFITETQLNTSFNRLNTEMFGDRLLQFKYAYESIKNKYLIGYGLDKYAYIDKTLVPLNLKGKIIGAHNGFLAILTQYGLLFGVPVLYVIFKYCISFIYYFRFNDDSSKFFVFIIIYTLIAAMYESLIVGINEFHTIFFWLSLAVLSFLKFYEIK